MEDINNTMKNATVSNDMKTVTLYFDQPWKSFGLCHVWPPKNEGILANTTDKYVEQRWVVDMVMIKFYIINPNNLIFRNIYFAWIAENGKTIYFYYPLIPGNIKQDPAMF